MDRVSTAEQQRKSLTIAKIYFQKHLPEEDAQSYLTKRGLSRELIRKFEIGYAPAHWRGLVDHYTSHSMRLAGLDAGVIAKMNNSDRMLDFFRDRLMFPIRTAEGGLVGYGGRLLAEKETFIAEGKKPPPKYLNTPETDLFQKSQLLYGLHQNLGHIKAQREVAIVEGYMDVISLHGAGLEFGVAPMGTALTEEQVHLLMGLGVRKLWLCLDGDVAGQKAAERSLEVIMKSYTPLLDVRVVLLAGGHDPDSFVREHGGEAFRSLMASSMSLPDFIESICLKGLPEKLSLEDKAIYLMRLEDYLAPAGGTLQQELIKRATALTGLKPEQIAQGKYQRAADQQVKDWHPLVALAARWLWHERNEGAATQFEKLNLSSQGMRELRSLARQIVTGQDAEESQMLRAFAIAHGRLSPDELTTLSQQWPQWRRTTALTENISTLRERPFDQDAASAIRTAFQLR